MKRVDASGLSCPEPVLRTRNALKDLPKEEELVVLVDTVTSRDNVTRMAQKQGCEVKAEETAHGFRLVITK